MPTLAPPCKLVRQAPDRLRVPRSTVILWTLSKSDREVLITWSPSGYTPVRPECPDAPSSSCLQIKMWQLTRAHGVTRNEPKIHVICYITKSYYLFALICCIRLLHDRSFHLYHHIINTSYFVASYLFLLYLYGVVLCCGLKSFSLNVFLFFSHDQVFMYEISLFCQLKYPWNCFFLSFLFFRYYCSVDPHVVVLFLVDVISLSLFFFMLSLSGPIDESTLSSIP